MTHSTLHNQLLVELVVRRLGAIAAGIWEDHDGGARLAQGVGSSDALAEMDTAMDGADLENDRQHVIELVGQPSRRLVLRFEENGPGPGGSETIVRALSGLCLALDRTLERLSEPR